MPRATEGKRNSKSSYETPAAIEPDAMQRIAELEDQLSRATKQLETVVLDYESAIEELQTAREELYATNEELLHSTQHLLEEREQLISSSSQSSAEVERLVRRLEERSARCEEMGSLLDLMEIPVAEFGTDLLLRYYTSAAARHWELMPSDLGRHIGDLAASVELPRIEPLCQQVAITLTPRIGPPSNFEGRPMVVSIRPFAGRQHRAVRVAVLLIPQDSKAASIR